MSYPDGRPWIGACALKGAARAAALVLAGALLLTGSGAVTKQEAAAAENDCGRPELASAVESIFWDSFSSYRARVLTVRVQVTNGGGNSAFSVTLNRTTATGEVSAVTALPLNLTGTLLPAAVASGDLRLLVPEGVASFRLNTFMSAADFCSNSYEYPPPEGEGPAGGAIFPPDNYWNTPVDGLPLDAGSGAYVQTIGAGSDLRPDFGSGTWDGSPIGIPYMEIDGSQPGVEVVFDYADESDPGPYPIPPDAPIEGGPASDGDRHVILLDRENRMLYELFYAWPQPDGSWAAGSGAIYDLSSNTLRPAGLTSADAAGLPILPGLVRYDEVAAGEISHALRFTAPQTRRAYIWPARHFASSLTGSQYPPMGQRFRLKADYDISGFSPENQVILAALKRYGMVLADNGSPWFVSGAPDERWDNEDLSELRRLKGSDFEAVDTSSLMVDPDSGQARQ